MKYQEVDQFLVLPHKNSTSSVTTYNSDNDIYNDDASISDTNDIDTAVQPTAPSGDTVPSTSDQNLAFTTSLASNNFTPIFAAFFQAMTSSILSTTTGSTLASIENSNTSPTNRNQSNMTSSNVGISKKFCQIKLKIITYIFFIGSTCNFIYQ
jgi:hypothetical protein